MAAAPPSSSLSSSSPDRLLLLPLLLLWVDWPRWLRRCGDGRWGPLLVDGGAASSCCAARRGEAGGEVLMRGDGGEKEGKKEPGWDWGGMDWKRGWMSSMPSMPRTTSSAPDPARSMGLTAELLAERKSVLAASGAGERSVLPSHASQPPGCWGNENEPGKRGDSGESGDDAESVVKSVPKSSTGLYSEGEEKSAEVCGIRDVCQRTRSEGKLRCEKVSTRTGQKGTVQKTAKREDGFGDRDRDKIKIRQTRRPTSFVPPTGIEVRDPQLALPCFPLHMPRDLKIKARELGRWGTGRKGRPCWRWAIQNVENK
ncbi:hypothetical protein VTK73DRAFT_6082 [Phialemonium thermophilum]|uniref:Uncharacterized protein n=1 Tax=Phialemonium thermophilum TaxID=223376 RepID=A0ABR3V036_9PEZI